MARNANNSLLHKAKGAKCDEFYTQLSDIESELVHYKANFAGQTVYCNCDDPTVSNFYKYFASNFEELGLRKLITSCYRESHKSLFNEVEEARGSYSILTGRTATDTPTEHRLKGNGDFRSAECVALLKEADIVVTNPPFSLFREFVDQLVRFNKKFLIIGNINAITYKEIFSLIKDNKAWLGVNLGRGISGFIVPENYELYGTETRINELGQRIVSPNNCLWLTNLELSKRHEDIPLSKVYSGNEAGYPKYDNYDGINVNKTTDIPMDYAGAMGVPITFLHKFNPDQFEIIKFRKGVDDKDLSINGKCPYFRILIRNKRLFRSTI